MSDEPAELADRIIPGIPDQLIAAVGISIKDIESHELATFILCGSLDGKIEPHHNGYEHTKHLAESDGNIRDDILECVKLLVMRRPEFQKAR